MSPPPMPVKPCPLCGTKSPIAIEATESRPVRYYQCLACGYVWLVQNDEPDELANDVIKWHRN